MVTLFRGLDGEDFRNELSTVKITTDSNISFASVIKVGLRDSKEDVLKKVSNLLKSIASDIDNGLVILKK